MKVITKVNNFIKDICAVLLVLMTFLVILQIIFRTIINHSVAEIEEIARYCMIWVALLGSALGVLNKSHVAVDLLVGKLSSNKKRFFSILSYILMGMIFLIFLYYGTALSKQAMLQQSPSMPWLKMGYIMSVIPITGLLGLVNIIAIIVEELKNKGGE